MTPDHLPPRLSPDELPPFTDQAAVELAWRTLIGSAGFASPELWLLFVDGDRPRHLLQVEDMPLRPGPADRTTIAQLLDHLLDDRRSCAFLFGRPGGRGRTAGDLAWARSLVSICDRWPVHLANDVELRVAAPDDLAATG